MVLHSRNTLRWFGTREESRRGRDEGSVALHEITEDRTCVLFIKSITAPRCFREEVGKNTKEKQTNYKLNTTMQKTPTHPYTPHPPPHTHIHTRTHTRARARPHMHAHARTHAHTRTHTHTHTRIHTHTHTHTHTQVCKQD